MTEVDWKTHRRTASGRIVKKSFVPANKGASVINRKDKLFAQEYFTNGFDAKKAANISDPGTKTMGLYRKNRLKRTFAEILDKQGVTDPMLANVLKDGLTATKIHSSPTEPDIELADHNTRHKFLETALKVKGHMSNIESQNNIQVNILDYKE